MLAEFRNFGIHTLQEIYKMMYTNHLTRLCNCTNCKVLITILVMFSLFNFGNMVVKFYLNFTIFESVLPNYYLQVLTYS